MKACAALWPLIVIPCIVEKQRRIHKGMAVLLFDRIWYRALWIQNGAAPRPLSCGNVIKRQLGWSALSATTRIDPSPYTIKISWAEKPLRYFFCWSGARTIIRQPNECKYFWLQGLLLPLHCNLLFILKKQSLWRSNSFLLTCWY